MRCIGCVIVLIKINRFFVSENCRYLLATIVLNVWMGSESELVKNVFR